MTDKQKDQPKTVAAVVCELSHIEQDLSHRIEELEKKVDLLCEISSNVQSTVRTIIETQELSAKIRGDGKGFWKRLWDFDW